MTKTILARMLAALLALGARAATADCLEPGEGALAQEIRERLGGSADHGQGCVEAGELADLDAWCAALTVDFPAQRGIVHVEPVARAERYDDLAFTPWQDHCPTLSMNEIELGTQPLAALEGLDVTPPLPDPLA